MDDLVALVADKDAEFSLRGILERHESLGIRRISFDIFVHPEKDPACLKRAGNFLAPFPRQYRNCVVIFDRHGCGQEQWSSAALEARVEAELHRVGWSERAAAVVIDPELENWVWSDSPHVASVIGWSDGYAALRHWLAAEGLFSPEEPKPRDPKLCFDRALRHVGKNHSAAIFGKLASVVGLKRCADASFLKLNNVLKKWFGPQESAN